MSVAEIANFERVRNPRFNAKEVLFPENGEEFVFPVASGSFELAGKDQVFRKSAIGQEHPARGEGHNDVL